MTRPALTALAVSLLFTLSPGCGGGEDDDAGLDRDATVPPRDAGSTDAGASDAGAVDGAAGDAGAPIDAGEATDASVEDDGGAETDAGPDLDAGPEPDAGPESDAGLDPCAPRALPALSAELVSDELIRPVFVAQAPGSTDTLWVLEKAGHIRLVRGGAVLTEDFLDLTGVIGGPPGLNDERGLLGLAFHPDYATNGRFFVYYTPLRAADDNDVVAEYRVMPGDADRADPTEVDRLVEVDTLETNHNGGGLAFGPDGYLYVGMGDGGSGGDPHGPIGNGQNTSTLHGSILRLDVDAGPSFAAAGNPFVGGGGAPQIWAYGLRNPWRFSFDRDTGDLYVGDVGQVAREEIDIEPSGSPGGANYGWRGYEGNRVFDSTVAGMITNHAAPVLDYPQDSTTAVVRDGCAVTGGYVYRGDAIPALDGVYFYTDYCSGDVGAFRWCDGAIVDHRRVPGLGRSNTVSFGEDQAGELYIVNQSDHSIFRIVSP